MDDFMKIRNIAVFATLTATASLLAGHAMAQTCRADGKPALVYPASPKVTQIDDYHGTKVADPYRWLEDTNSAQTHAWVAEQNKLTQNYLAQIPARAQIKARMTALWNFERYSVPLKEGGRYFYSRNNGLQNQSVLYTLDDLNQAPRVLLDPNLLSRDGTVALTGTVVSPNGKLLAYGTAASGSDWNEWHVRDIDSGKDRLDHLQWVKFSSASWARDSSGFYYSRYNEPQVATQLADVNYFQKLYFHKIGTPQSADVLVYQRPDHKDWGFSGHVSDDGHYLIITVSEGTARKNRLYYKDLQQADAPVLALLDDFDAAYDFIDNEGPVFWLRTDKNAARARIITIDVRQPQAANWHEVVAEAPETLQSANIVDHKLILEYLKDARSQVKIVDLHGKPIRDVDLPGIGSAAGFPGHAGDSETFYSYTSFTSPSAIYRYDLKTGKSTLYRQPKINFDPSAFETRQVFFSSRDGTRVPMFIVSKKGIKLDGKNPTYLYGYGGFDISLTPAFSVPNLTWMEMGGVYVMANLRGGGEYGESWHLAGTKLHKQNVFDDFIGAAEWLIANHYTLPSKLAIGGRSNGGLLIGAALTQRPDLFGAALPGVGVMDMLRFHKFTIGWAWQSDYGSSDNAEEFKALYAYSPLHNLKPGTCYPPTMIITADHDDRVVPGHSFKFAATAQQAQAGAAPILIRIETKAGHGAGKPTSKQIEEAADSWAFLLKSLNMKLAAPVL